VLAAGCGVADSGGTAPAGETSFASKQKARALDLSATNTDHLGVTLRVGDECWRAFASIYSPLGGEPRLPARMVVAASPPRIAPRSNGC